MRKTYKRGSGKGLGGNRGGSVLEQENLGGRARASGGKLRGGTLGSSGSSLRKREEKCSLRRNSETSKDRRETTERTLFPTDTGNPGATSQGVILGRKVKVVFQGEGSGHSVGCGFLKNLTEY